MKYGKLVLQNVLLVLAIVGGFYLTQELYMYMIQDVILLGYADFVPVFLTTGFMITGLLLGYNYLVRMKCSSNYYMAARVITFVYFLFAVTHHLFGITFLTQFFYNYGAKGVFNLIAPACLAVTLFTELDVYLVKRKS